MESLNNNGYFKFHPNIFEDIRKAYNLEKPGAISDAIDILEEWLKKQDHFVKKDFDRNYLERTIIRAKGSIERSKQKLDKLCTARTLTPSFFFNGKAKDFEHLELVEDAFLPKLTSDHYRIYLCRIQTDIVDSTFYTNFYRRFVHQLEYQNFHDYSNGMIAVIDFRKCNILNFVKNIDLVEFQSMINIILNCYGLRIKGIHFISESKTIELLVAVVKQVLSEKLKSRFRTHKTIESLYQYVEKDVLTEDYGGTEKPLTEVFNKFTEEINSDEHTEHIKMMYAACTDESCRRTDKFNENCLGMPGTFRAFKVD